MHRCLGLDSEGKLIVRMADEETGDPVRGCMPESAKSLKQGGREGRAVLCGGRNTEAHCSRDHPQWGLGVGGRGEMVRPSPLDRLWLLR